MRVHVFASGSSGNCLLVEEDDTKVLIDAGISRRRVMTALNSVGCAVEQIGGVLITHEHSDHISGLESLVKGRRLPVFAPHTVAARLEGAMPSLSEHLQVIPVGERFPFGRLQITAFHTSHDTDESVGYLVEGSGIYAHATDTGCVTEDMRRFLTGADTVLLESNHDEDMLRYGRYPFYLKKRILSARGHLSNADCAAFARELAENGTGQIILAHLSRENNTPRKAMECAAAALEGLGTALYCAPVLGCLTVEIRNSEWKPDGASLL
jgi:phosphoribosyl 1,2-cyclic phosphodiesterase